MGFRTLAIEKRSSEVWKILGAVKTEFSRFGDVLKKAQEKIQKAGEDIDELVGTRTRKIQSKLKEVQELPYTESSVMLGDAAEETTD
jgi:DNA recombination protein RmuC